MIREAIRKARRAGVAAFVASLSVLPVGFAAAETADEFVARLNQELAAIGLESAAAGWTQGTYITVDTQLLNARANERFLEYFSTAVEQARQFDGQPMSPSSRRALDLLRLGVSAPAPDDAAEARRACEACGRHGGQVRLRDLVPAGTRVVPQRDPAQAGAGDESRLRRTARGLARLARRSAAAATRLRTLRRACQRGREGARLRRPRRDVALGLRHAGGRVHPRGGPPVRPGGTALPRPALLCARPARAEVRRRQGAGREADSGAPAGQHVGPAVGCDLRPARALSRRQRARCRRGAREAGLRRGHG